MSQSATESLLEISQRVVKARSRTLKGALKNLVFVRRFEVVDLTKRQLNDDSGGRVNDCEACQNICCESPNSHVRLRLFDIARLLDAGLEHGIVIDKNDDPRESEARYPRLKENENGRCVFLSAQKRCEIYEHRPMRCRRFPYKLSPGKTAIEYATGCESSKAGTPGEVEALRDAVISLYHQKLQDGLVRLHAEEEIRAHPVGAYLPE